MAITMKRANGKFNRFVPPPSTAPRTCVRCSKEFFHPENSRCGGCQGEIRRRKDEDDELMKAIEHYFLLALLPGLIIAAGSYGGMELAKIFPDIYPCIPLGFAFLIASFVFLAQWGSSRK